MKNLILSLGLLCTTACVATHEDVQSLPEWLSACENGACVTCDAPLRCADDGILLCESSVDPTGDESDAFVCPTCACTYQASTSIVCPNSKKLVCRDSVCECQATLPDPCPLSPDVQCKPDERRECTKNADECEVCECIDDATCPPAFERDCDPGQQEVCETNGDGCEICTCETNLRWFATCGDPVCAGHRDSGLPKCTTETIGDACKVGSPTCDPGNDCNAHITCADSDPTLQVGGCPRSRRAVKEEIHYLEKADLKTASAELLRIPLATYTYRNVKNPRQNLGFIIEDVEPSLAVHSERDQVDLYGYLSMAVATLKLQQERIEALEARIAPDVAPLCSE